MVAPVALSTEYLKTMLMLGIAASSKKMFQDADAIFKGVIAYKKDMPHAHMGLAVIEVAKANFAKAIELLEETNVMFPKFMVTKALLALVLKTKNKEGWEDLVKIVLQDNADPVAVKLAKEVLGEESLAVSAPLKMPLTIPAGFRI
jgi:hypothetical protein